jgi:hypothetical protein
MAGSLGKYYDQTKAGRVFHGSTAVAGTAFPISTSTAMTFGLWNITSKKNAVLLSLNLGYTSGTVAVGEIGLTNTFAGDTIGTGAPISAFTDGVLGTTIRNGMIGQGAAPACRFTPSASTIVASTACYWTGHSFSTASTVSDSSFIVEFDGKIILPPGQAVFLVGSIAQTALFTATLTWAEVDA